MNHDKESDPTNASANVSADIPPTHYQHINQHTTNASADTLLTLPREKRNSKSPQFGNTTYTLQARSTAWEKKSESPPFLK